LRTSELYASAPVRAALGPALRPGGEALTRRMLDLVRPRPGAAVLDAGCGCGATLALLRTGGVRAVGLDMSRVFLREAGAVGASVAQADLAFLPCMGGGLDLILCECAWNLTDKERVLAEFFRVLRPGGVLALADIYARGQGGRSSAASPRPRTWRRWSNRSARPGSRWNWWRTIRRC
jgi:SAM-dependent methyltransferase